MTDQTDTSSRETFTAFRLANECDVACPDSEESAGSAFLLCVQDGVHEHLAYCDDSGCKADQHADACAEIADAAPDVYTGQKWAEFLDLCAWQWSEEALSDLGADTETDMDRQASIVLYWIADKLAHRLFELDEDEDDEDAE